MVEMHAKIQKWFDSVLADELENVAKEMKELADTILDLKSNRMVFKILLCLSHTAERTKTTHIRTGMEIFNITNSLCYSLREIPDLFKYFSSLYHIAKKLIAMRLYSEAMTVTVWTFPGNLVRDLNRQQSDMYSKIASLWRGAANMLIESAPDGLTLADYNVLLELVKNEFKVLNVIAKERPAFVFSRILRYLIELEAVPKAPDCKNAKVQSYHDIAKHFLAYIDVSSVTEEKCDIYRDALRFVNYASTTLSSESSIENTLPAFEERCSMIEIVFETHPELASTFLIYKNMGTMLLKPIRNSKKLPHWNPQQIVDQTKHVMQIYQNNEVTSWNMRMIGFILEPVIKQWEQRIIAADFKILNATVLRDILEIVIFTFSFLNLTSSASCEVCRDNACQMKKNIYSVTVIGSQCIAMLSKLPAGDLLKAIFPAIQTVLEETIAAIFEMKESKCGKWSYLWNSCGINIYNLSVTYHKESYDGSIFLFSLLCSCLVKFNGLDALKKALGIANSLAFILHRLSGIHFHHRKYREALTPCALNALLSYEDPDSRAFHKWAVIKHSAAGSSDVSQKTMLSILREDMDIISAIGIDVRLENYDLVKLCRREIRGLNEARSYLFTDMCRVLDEMEALNCGDFEYAKGVHLLEYHRMNHLVNQMVYDNHFQIYLTRANQMLDNKKSQSSLHRIAKGNMSFFNFVEKQYICAGMTQSQMKCENYGLPTSKQSYHEGELKSAENLIPFSNINIRTEFETFVELEKALDHWNRGITGNIARDDEWYWSLTLSILTVAGEYTRLHKMPHIETKVWLLAYKLACQLNDIQARLHVVGRSLSLHNMNNEWIEATNKLLAVWKATGELERENAVGFYLINESNFYYEIGKYEEAGKTLKRALDLPALSPFKNIVPYLSSVDTIVRNHHFYATEDNNTKFMAYVVRCLYAMLCLMDDLPPAKHGAKLKYLCAVEILMRCTASMSLRMNSILSYREITCHLTLRLKFAQNWGLTLCVAECLKNLCFIDLDRMQLENCLVKLQGLENILQVNSPKNSYDENPPLEIISTNQLNKPGCRDPRANVASPVLGKKIYNRPEFMEHNFKRPCSCYKCENYQYQYLVLSSIHVRAKLYFFEGWLNEALSCFTGAFSLHTKLLQADSRRFSNAVEYALLLIDFSRCIRELRTGNNRAEMNVAMAAVNICEKFHLQSHPIYVSARELVLEYQFCCLFPTETAFDKFTVPDPIDIDIDKFIFGKDKIDYSTISTPSLKPCDKKPKTMKRVKTPPLLQLTKVTMDLSEDEEEFESPKSSRYRPKKFHIYPRQKSLKKKNLEKYLDSGPEPCAAQTDATATSTDVVINKVQKTLEKIESVASSMFPNLSKQISEIVDETGSSDLEKISRLIELIKQLMGRSESGIKSSNFGRLPSSKIASGKPVLSKKAQDAVVDELVSSFEEMMINKDKDQSVNISSNTYAVQSDVQKLKKNSLTIISTDVKDFDFNEKSDIPDFLNNCATFSSYSNDTETKLVTPKTTGHEQRLKTSARIKKSVTRTEETDQTKYADDLGVNLSLGEAVEDKKEQRKRVGQKKKLKESVKTKSKTLEGESNRDSSDSGGAERSKSPVTGASFSELKEISQFNESDIVQTSDVDEIAAREERKSDINKKSKLPTTSRILRSRSRPNGALAGAKNANNSNCIRNSGNEKSSEITTDENKEPKSRSKVSSTAKKSGKTSDTLSINSNLSGNQENRGKINKRPTSGRAKRQR